MLISNNSNCLFLKYNPQISISYLPSATALTKVGLPKGTHAHPLGPSSRSSHARSPRVALKTPPSCARRNPPPNFQAAPSTPKLRCSPDPVPDSTLVLGNFVLGMNLTFTSNWTTHKALPTSLFFHQIPSFLASASFPRPTLADPSHLASRLSTRQAAALCITAIDTLGHLSLNRTHHRLAPAPAHFQSAALIYWKFSVCSQNYSSLYYAKVHTHVQRCRYVCFLPPKQWKLSQTLQQYTRNPLV